MLLAGLSLLCNIKRGISLNPLSLTRLVLEKVYVNGPKSGFESHNFKPEN